AGSRGDVQPIAALSRGLQDAGHEVLIATHERFRPLVESEGLAFRPLPGDPLEMLESPTGQAWVRSGRNSFSFLLNYIQLTRPTLPALLRASQRAVEGADLIVFTPFAPAGLHLAEAMGIPVAMAALQPFHPTGEFPAMGAVGTVGLPWLNRISHRVTDLLLWLPFRDLINRWRVDDLDLRPWSLTGPLARMEANRTPTIYGYSPSVIRRPKDWGPWIEVTGYWFLDRKSGWRPPERLRRFLGEGDPPIYVGFGSMVSGEGNRLELALAQVVRKLGCRAVLQRGWEGIPDSSLGNHVLTIGSVPHDWLFPRVAAVVHHGGAGTTGAGLRAGVPSVLIPHFADQFLWADKVHSIGAGPAPIPLQGLDGDRLVASIKQVLSSGSIRSRAAAVGAAVRAESGVSSAVEILSRLD
ncbi:MAG: glycosyltransferase, partial [Anaerolineales bacterium]